MYSALLFCQSYLERLTSHQYKLFCSITEETFLRIETSSDNLERTDIDHSSYSVSPCTSVNILVLVIGTYLLEHSRIVTIR